MLNNKVFIEWVEKQKKGLEGHNEYWLIGLMTQWLLDKGYDIGNVSGRYYCSKLANGISLYDCLVEAINKLGEV
jgi:hypothetical protein